MNSTYAEFARLVRDLAEGAQRLEASAQLLELPPLCGREWYSLLAEKLLPQLTDDAYLVVAVVGGTNIGKSAVFNHLAGFQASAISPMASGTKHPVCLVPAGFAAAHRLEAIFPHFELRSWSDPAAALATSESHLLFWKEAASLPGNLIVLDTPDIDSDAKVNWQRAEGIRRSADVLITVLTQQKYNDAAVKQFFREAAKEDKALLVVFNQVLLPEDEPYWPQWLRTFCSETGARPDYVYLAPNDRRAANELRLPFYERHWEGEAPAARQGRSVPPAEIQSTNLMAVLSQLRFAEIKLRTLRGSLQRIIEPDAFSFYLQEIMNRSAGFESAARLLTAHRLAEVEAWPQIPTATLVGEIRHWWGKQRDGWTAQVHGVYNTVGTALWWPVKKIQEQLQGPAIDPLEKYRQQEWDAVLLAVKKVFDQLTWLSELGNDLLKPRLEKLLSGQTRTQLLQQLEREQRAVNFAEFVQGVVAEEMDSFRSENPKYYQLFRQLDSAAAAARPVTSVALFIGGAGFPLGDLLTHATMQTAMHIMGDVAGGAAAAAVGETAISSTASQGVGYLEAKFRKLQSLITSRRVTWLAENLHAYLLKELSHDLQAAAAIPHSEEYRQVERTLRELRERLQATIPATAEWTSPPALS